MKIPNGPGLTFLAQCVLFPDLFLVEVFKFLRISFGPCLDTRKDEVRGFDCLQNSSNESTLDDGALRLWGGEAWFALSLIAVVNSLAVLKLPSS